MHHKTTGGNAHEIIGTIAFWDGSKFFLQPDKVLPPWTSSLWTIDRQSMA
jgi:hypothetical protein